MPDRHIHLPSEYLDPIGIAVLAPLYRGVKASMEDREALEVSLRNLWDGITLLGDLAGHVRRGRNVEDLSGVAFRRIVDNHMERARGMIMLSLGVDPDTWMELKEAA